MFCQKCGKEIMDEAVVCPHCGCATTNYGKKSRQPAGDDVTSTGLLVASVLIPMVGIVLGIINLCNEKKRSGGIYLACGFVSWIIAAVILSCM